VQTRIVNNSIMKKDGKYSVDDANPFFEECKTKADLKWSGEKSKGVLRSIAEVAHGGADKLDEAVRRQEVKVVDDNGQKFYSWRELQTGKRTQITALKTIGRKNAIDQNQFDKISSVLESMGWEFAVSPALEQQARRENDT
jgi:hypothetical protein